MFGLFGTFKPNVCEHTFAARPFLLVDVLKGLWWLRLLLFLLDFWAMSRYGLHQLLILLTGVLHDDDPARVQLVTKEEGRAPAVRQSSLQ